MHQMHGKDKGFRFLAVWILANENNVVLAIQPRVVEAWESFLSIVSFWFGFSIHVSRAFRVVSSQYIL